MGALGIVQTAVFDQGGTISSPVFVGNNRPVCVEIPANWADLGSPAVLTFQGSSDGVTFSDIYDGLGNEVTCVVAAGQLVQLPTPTQLPLYLQFRSGPGASPVAQTEGPTLTITITKLPYI